ncbi:MAG: site-specific DNA-methyltransferase [Chloroflexi bacterium]|nr:site-specific DNA-methyltransferase [Chloroflexota bacterium]
MTTANRAPLVFSDEQALADALHSTQQVDGLTHRFYRYPARFSPEFVRHVISALSEPGDTVLDPFMGGGTTIVEALAAGRRAVGVDINGLSQFITRVKTTPLSERDAGELIEWGRSLELDMMALHGETDVQSDHRAKNLPDEVRCFLGAAVQSVGRLRFPRQRRFARCVLLRVGQWALDNRQHPPMTDKICAQINEEIQDMLTGLREFVQAAQSAGFRKNKITGNRALIQASVAEAPLRRAIGDHVRTPKLLLTSPPYPGVHVLYHRWQVSGRRETPAPYWLADLRDGHGASYYTMGSRSKLGLRNYFATLRRGFENLRNMLSPDATVVQLVAFSDTQTQLPLYMDTLAAAGYKELQVPSLLASGSHIRTVPHRKWYTNRQDREGDAGHEVLMVHRPGP